MVAIVEVLPQHVLRDGPAQQLRRREAALGCHPLEAPVTTIYGKCRHRALRLGLVDAIVVAVAERLAAGAIATLDVRHFGAIRIKGRPKLLPRDAW